MRISMHSQQTFPGWKTQTETYEEATWLLWLGDMTWGAELYINRHNGDQEKLVNGCGGQFRTVITFMKPWWALGSVPASSAVGACACPAGGGRQGENQTEGWGGQEDRQRPSGGLGTCGCMFTAPLFYVSITYFLLTSWSMFETETFECLFFFCLFIWKHTNKKKMYSTAYFTTAENVNVFCWKY